MDVTEPVDLLAFGPHPDDVELCAGGLMLRLGDQGYRLAVVDVTRGEGGSRGTPEIRAQETEAASRLMRLVGRENLDLPDTQVEETLDAVTKVVAAIRRWRPRVVLGPAIEDLHPDHVATARILDRAYYLATMVRFEAEGLPPHRPDVLVRYQGHLEPTPTFVVDVSDVWERRMELVRCYASQLGLDGREGPTTNISAPDFMDRVASRYAYWGAKIGARYAEPFVARRFVPLDDPIQAFRKRGWAVL